MVGLFLVAAAVNAVAIPPSLVSGRPAAYAGGRTRRSSFGTCRRLRTRWRPQSRARSQPLTPSTFEPASRSPSDACRRPATSPAPCASAPWSARPSTTCVAPRPLEQLPELPAPARDVRVDRPVRTVPRAGRDDRGCSRAPPADHRGRPGGQPAGEARELTDGVVHLVLFHLHYADGVVASELDIVLGLGFLLTVHESEWDPHESHHLASRHRRTSSSTARTTCSGRSCDDVVDGYFPFADLLGDAIDEVQDEVDPHRHPADVRARCSTSSGELIEVRRCDQPGPRGLQPADQPRHAAHRRRTRSSTSATSTTTSSGSPTSSTTYRELAASTLDVYLTQVNNNLSVIMKRLTGVTVILAGIGAVAGIFGMSEATPPWVAPRPADSGS